MAAPQPRKPELKLLGTDGNIFSIFAKARRVALANGMDWEKIQNEASEGDYDHALRTLMEYFEVV